MNRRAFTSSLGALGVGLLFPRKSEASVERGMTDEEMAEWLVQSKITIKLISHVIRAKMLIGVGDAPSSATMFSPFDWRTTVLQPISAKRERRSEGTFVFSRFSRRNRNGVVVEEMEGSLNVAEINHVSCWSGIEGVEFGRVNGLWVKLGNASC